MASQATQCMSDHEPTKIGSSCIPPSSAPVVQYATLIGKGGEGAVYAAVLQDGTRVAIKRRPARHIARARDEQHVLNIIASSRIVPAPKIFVDVDRTVLEVYPLYASDLHAMIDRANPSSSNLPIDLARQFSRQLAEAIVACHSNNVAHLDIKLENILVDHKHENIVLADFGAARRADIKYYRRLGTRQFCAPECWSVHDPRFPKQYCVRAADIWSFGQCVLAMTTGHTAGWNTKGDVSWSETARKFRLAPEICEVLQHTLQFDPKRRVSAEKLFEFSWLCENETNSDIASFPYFETPPCSISCSVAPDAAAFSEVLSTTSGTTSTCGTLPSPTTQASMTIDESSVRRIPTTPANNCQFKASYVVEDSVCMECEV